MWSMSGNAHEFFTLIFCSNPHNSATWMRRITNSNNNCCDFMRTHVFRGELDHLGVHCREIRCAHWWRGILLRHRAHGQSIHALPTARLSAWSMHHHRRAANVHPGRACGMRYNSLPSFHTHLRLRSLPSLDRADAIKGAAAAPPRLVRPLSRLRRVAILLTVGHCVVCCGCGVSLQCNRMGKEEGHE